MRLVFIYLNGLSQGCHLFEKGTHTGPVLRGDQQHLHFHVFDAVLVFFKIFRVFQIQDQHIRQIPGKSLVIQMLNIKEI